MFMEMWSCPQARLADGRLTTGHSDHVVRIWEPHTGACVAELHGHTGAVSAVAVALTHTPSTLITISRTQPHRHQYQVVAHGLLASSSLNSWDHGIRLWDPHSGACVKELCHHSGAVICLASAHVVDPGLDVLVSGSQDKTMQVQTSLCCHGHTYTHTSTRTHTHTHIPEDEWG